MGPGDGDAVDETSPETQALIDGEEGRLQLGQQRDRALVRAAGAAIASRMVTAVTVVASIAIAARALSNAELGVVTVLTTLIVFLGFGDFGLGTLLMTRLPIAAARGDEDEERELVSGVLSTLVLLGLVLGGVGALSGIVAPWPSLLGAERLSEGTVRLAVVTFFIAGGASIPAGLGSRVLAARQRGDVVHAWNAVTGVVSLILTGVVAALDLPLWAYVVALAAPPAMLGSVQTVWTLWRHAPRLRPRSLRLDLRATGALLKAGLMFAAISISAAVSFYIDSLVVSSVRGAADAAVFAVAARMFALVGGTLNLAGQQLWSALADALARGDRAWARHRLRRVLVVTASVNIVACAVLVAAGPTLAEGWVGEDLIPPRALLLTLGIWTVFSTALFQGAYVLAAVERIRVIAIIGLLSTPINVALSVAMTSWLGLYGPPLGSLCTAALLVLPPTVYMARQELRRTDIPDPLPG